MTKPSCLRCRFYQPQPHHEKTIGDELGADGNWHKVRRQVGECRAQPPTKRGGEFARDVDYSQSTWPWVYGDVDWCAVFKDRSAA